MLRKTTKQVWLLLHDADRSQFYRFLIGGALLALLETIGISSIIPFVTLVTNPDAINQPGLYKSSYQTFASYTGQAHYSFVLTMGGATCFFLMISTIFKIVLIIRLNNYIESKRHRLSVNLLKSYLEKNYDFYIDRNTSDLAKLILSETDMFIQNVFRPVFRMLVHSALIVPLVLLIAITNPVIAIYGILGLSIFYLITFLYANSRIKEIGNERLHANGKRFKSIDEAFGSIKQIKVQNMTSAALQQFSEPSEIYSSATAKQQSFSHVPKYILEGTVFIVIIIMVLVNYRSVEGDSNNVLISSLPNLLFLSMAMYRLQPSAQSLYQGLIALVYGQKAVQSIYHDIVDEKHSRKTRNSNSKKGLHNHLKPNDSVQVVRCNNLSYKYPKSKSETNSVNDITISFKRGQTSAIVGKSGAGKSTLIDLLVGLYEPDNGHIEFLTASGLPIEPNTVDIAYVPQASYISDASFLENITSTQNYGSPDYSRVSEIIDTVGLRDLLKQNFNNDIDAGVGDHGAKLSGGQKQRLALARCLYENADIYVFDEAFGALDFDSEVAIFSAIKRYLSDKIVILITHRMEALKDIDQIILMDQGKFIAGDNYVKLHNDQKLFSDLCAY